MELFDKIYGCYYTIMGHILEAAARSPVTRKEMEDICRTYGFQESFLAALPAVR